MYVTFSGRQVSVDCSLKVSCIFLQKIIVTNFHQLREKEFDVENRTFLNLQSPNVYTLGIRNIGMLLNTSMQYGIINYIFIEITLDNDISHDCDNFVPNVQTEITTT